MAVKYNEVKQISLDFLINKIAYNKFDKEVIIVSEIVILKKLNFRIPKTNFNDFLFNLNELLIESEDIELFKNSSQENIELKELIIKDYMNNILRNETKKLSKTINTVISTF